MVVLASHAQRNCYPMLNQLVTEDPALAADWAGFLAGNTPARDRLYARCYDEFRHIAQRVLRRNQTPGGLQTTELVNEAAMRLLRLDRMNWQDKGHFLAMAARTMRQVLIDESRRDLALKRGGVRVQTTWLTNEHGAVTTGAGIELEKLDSAMRELHGIAPERARLVELRFFSGLTIEETALAMGISDTTVKRQWRAARAWLLAYLSDTHVEH